MTEFRFEGLERVAPLSPKTPLVNRVEDTFNLSRLFARVKVSRPFVREKQCMFSKNAHSDTCPLVHFFPSFTSYDMINH